jgi:uroporphyrinogen-III decarboxylase
MKRGKDDGKMKRILPFVLRAGADVAMTLTPAPVGDIDPVEVKETYGSRIALQGGFEVIHLVHNGTPEQVKKEVREKLPLLKRGGGYVFDTSNSIPAGTPIENVRAFFRAAHECAGY